MIAPEQLCPAQVLSFGEYANRRDHKKDGLSLSSTIQSSTNTSWIVRTSSVSGSPRTTQDRSWDLPL